MSRRSRRIAGWAAVAVVFLVGVSLAYVIGSRAQREAPPEPLPYVLVAIVLLLVVGLLFGLLIAAAITYSSLKLTDKSEALGLPAGSVRAFIALILLVVFPVVAVFTIGSVPENERKDLATQLLTAVTTLVVAVAAFYFGSKSVEAAARAESPLRLQVIRPKQGASLSRGNEGELLPLQVVVASEPEEAKLVATVKGDGGSLELDAETGDYMYTPGTPEPPPGTAVVLQFAHVDHPATIAAVSVQVPERDRAGEGSQAEK